MFVISILSVCDKTTNVNMNVSILAFSCVVVLFTVSVEGQRYGRRCPPLCRNFCPFGRVLDRNGCPTCRCLDRPTDACPRGSRPSRPSRRCSAFSRRGCGLNSFCSKSGVCCTRNIIEPFYHCPSNDIITTCQIRANSCTRHSDCPFGFKCCSRGCGKECVDAFGAGYFPGFTRGRLPANA